MRQAQPQLNLTVRRTDGAVWVNRRDKTRLAFEIYAGQNEINQGAIIVSNQSESTYYDQDNVLVTSQRAEFAGKTFAMSNITSVSMSTTKKSNQMGCGGLIVMVGIGLLPIVFSTVLLTDHEGGFFSKLFGILLLLGGGAWSITWIIQWLRDSESYTSYYAVNLTSASGESKAMESSNEQQITAIVEAIKQAIVERDALVASTPRQGPDFQRGIPEKLRDLKGLLDAGIITLQEYDAKKADLLAQL